MTIKRNIHPKEDLWSHMKVPRPMIEVMEKGICHRQQCRHPNRISHKALPRCACGPSGAATRAGFRSCADVFLALAAWFQRHFSVPHPPRQQWSNESGGAIADLLTGRGQRAARSMWTGLREPCAGDRWNGGGIRGAGAGLIQSLAFRQGPGSCVVVAQTLRQEGIVMSHIRPIQKPDDVMFR